MLRLLFLLVLSLGFINNLNAEYIKFGGGMLSQDGNKGYDFNLAAGLYSFGKEDKYTVGLALQQSIGNAKGLYKLYKDKSDDDEKLRIYKNDILKASSFTAAMITFDMDVFTGRGLYVFGGLGYGYHIKPRKSAGDLIDISTKIAEYNKNNKGGSNDPATNPQLVALLNDQELINAISNLANDTDSLTSLINQVLPNSQDLINQVNSPDKIYALINDKNQLNNFIIDVTNRYEQQYPNGFSFGGSGPSIKDLTCDVLLNCKDGVAYTLGLGYDLQIWRSLGLDFYGKMYGLFNSDIYYGLGANIIFKF
jgi:hypothetical protein